MKDAMNIKTHGCSHHHHDHKKQYVDPVCGMASEQKDQFVRYEHNGNNYYFCSDNCLKTFSDGFTINLCSRLLIIRPICPKCILLHLKARAKKLHIFASKLRPIFGRYLNFKRLETARYSCGFILLDRPNLNQI